MSNKRIIINKTSEYVKKILEGEGSGHDWWHVYRVWKMAKKISKREKGTDVFVIELAAILHDISDWKFNDGDVTVGSEIARNWLIKQKVSVDIVDHVCEIIEEASFKGAKVKSKIKTKEGMIVQDADRLDAIGAIGIARAFAYGGYKKRELYNPNIKPKKHKSFKEYQNSNSSTINHFYEKLLLLKDLMSTKTAREIAKTRHKYLTDFLERFLKEWERKI